MLVRDVMRKNVVVAKPSVTIREASKVMGDMHIGSLVVREEDDIIGILTERDVLLAVAKGVNPENVLIEEIMSKKVVTVESGKKLEDAVDLMMKHKIKKLPVIEGKKLVGIITASDIVVVEPKLIANIASLMSLKLPGYRGG
jgi:CBS domain-containing protein